MKKVVYKHSAGGVVINNGKVLLISSEIRNSVSLPKGTLDEGESPEQAAIREVKEETGYDVEIISKIGDYTYEFDWSDDEHNIKTVTYFSMQLANNNPPAPNLQGNEDFISEWVDIERAIEKLTYDEAKDAVKRAVENL